MRSVWKTTGFHSQNSSEWYASAISTETRNLISQPCVLPLSLHYSPTEGKFEHGAKVSGYVNGYIFTMRRLVEHLTENCS